MSRSGSRILDPVFSGVGAASPKEKQIASFGAKVVPSLNGVDLSL
jgi:hypothetical protein